MVHPEAKLAIISASELPTIYNAACCFVGSKVGLILVPIPCFLIAKGIPSARNTNEPTSVVFCPPFREVEVAFILIV
mgnify:CR=1 FL=1